MGDWVERQLGNYQLKSLLGEGGFAEVYLGEHIHLGTLAAIKVLHTQLGGEDIDKFRTEARTIARLLHPNIVRVLDFGVEGKTPFLVMDYAPKGTLRDQHVRGKPVPLPIVVSYVKQVAEALQCAHDEKLVHRDVKPVNMLIGRRGEILLSDFGIAIASQTSRQSTQDIIGTVSYMAPEQIQGKPRSASDQYALGIAAYEWLTGDVPFHGSFTEVAIQHVTMPPSALREKVPSISQDVERVVMTALEKDPQKRFGSVQAFANALEQASKSDGPVPVVVKPQEKVLEPTIVVPQATTPIVPLPPTQYVKIKPSERPLVRTYRGHSKKINKIAWSPNSRFIASASDDGTVHIFEAISANYLTRYRLHFNPPLCVAWSPNGKRVASGSLDKTVDVWSASSGANIAVYRGHSREVNAVIWSKDGTLIASSSIDRTIKVWDISVGNVRSTLSDQSKLIHALSWSPDQKQIVLAGDLIQIWNISAATVSILAYPSHSEIIYTVAWSPDGKYIASGDNANMIKIWNASTGETALTYKGHSDSVRELSWSPDGRCIASCSIDTTVQVWDVATGSRICNFQHHAPVHAVAWSPDGRYIASGGDDNIVQIWAAPQ